MSHETPFETIEAKLDGPVCRIKINRPKQLNALNSTVFAELEQVIFEMVDPVNTRVIVIEGAGDRAFAAGADIAAMQEMTPVEAREFSRHGQMVTKALETLPQVTIAKVRGYALGGGLELAMACDIIVAGQSARLGQPEVNLGIIPGFGGTQRLVHRVGLPVALDLLLSGRARSLTGAEAFQLGLVSRVVEDDKLDAELDKVVRGILGASPRAIAEVKRLTRDAYTMSLDAGLNAEANAFAACFAENEAQDGIAAFLEKRNPNFAV